MYQRILVPIDGSHTSTLGLKESIRIARDRGARLRLITVVDELAVAQNLEGYVNAGDLINRMVLGSDAEAVLRTSPVPVLMVRSAAPKKRKKRT